MAETKKPANVGEAILGENKNKIGEYQEAPGGGTPLAAGQKAPSKEWVAENRKMQPRDENGQFTYNSANAKPLAYGPSRGVTVPPFLRGVKLTYAVENKDVIIGEDGKRYLAGIDLSARDIVNAYKNSITSIDLSKYKISTNEIQDIVNKSYNADLLVYNCREILGYSYSFSSYDNLIRTVTFKDGNDYKEFNDISININIKYSSRFYKKWAGH